MDGDKSTAGLILVLLTAQTALLCLALVRLDALKTTLVSGGNRVGAPASPGPGETIEGFQAGDGPSLGASDAPVTLVEFSDFTCPSCATLKPGVRALLERYPDDLRLVFRYFPLASSGPPFQAALAAECARRQEAFWPMHDRLFTRAASLRGDPDLYREADDLGLSMDQFADCMASEAAAETIRSDAAAGLGYGISGTPTLFVNGRKFVGSGSIPQIELEIERILTS